MDSFNAIISAHKHSSIHREKLLSSEKCGCFYCLEIFKPSEINDWCDGEQTALCPKCGIDSVIGSNSKYSIEKDFLYQMKKHWFGDI